MTIHFQMHLAMLPHLQLAQKLLLIPQVLYIAVRMKKFKNLMKKAFNCIIITDNFKFT